MSYTETERRILDMWPRFEDGEPVWFGDDVGEIDARSFVFLNSGAMVTNLTSVPAYGKFLRCNEPLKRPAPKVLDADGVEIKVGDRVYSIDTGNSYTVRSVNGSGTIEFEGSECKGWSSKRFTHTQPAIDADGVLIKAGDTVYDAKGEGHIVKEVYFDDDESHERTVWCGEFKSGIAVVYIADQLTHIAPDSWERLEEDALKGVCEYAGAERKPGTIDAHTCCGCRFDEDGDGPTCEKQMALDIIRRAKALAEKEAAR